MKHVKSINEFFKTPNLTDSDIEEMIEYLENFADENEYNIYRPRSMDVSRLLPDETEKRITKDDSFGEENWEIEKPKLMSSSIMIFEDDSDTAKKILTFSWMTNSKICTNSLYIDKSQFNNIDLDMLKQLIEK